MRPSAEQGWGGVEYERREKAARVNNLPDRKLSNNSTRDEQKSRESIVLIDFWFAIICHATIAFFF